MKDCFYLQTHPFSLINITRGNNWPIHSAIAELIDNSIDASASIIEITMTDDNITIKDNGKGFTYSEIMSAFKTISEPPKDGDLSTIGRYNTGMKTASVRIGDSLTILTKTLGESIGLSFNVDWKKVCNNNQPIRNPIPYDVSFKQGTVISIDQLFQPSNRDKENIIYYIRKIFSRYINGGLVITLNNEKITSLPTISLVSERNIKGNDFTIRYGFYDYDKVFKSDWRYYDVIGLHIYYKNRLFHMAREQRTGLTIPYDKYYIEINTNSTKYGPNVHKDGLINLYDILTKKVISEIVSNLKKDHTEIQDDEDRKLANELTKMFSSIAKKKKQDKNGDLLMNEGQGRKPNEGDSEGGVSPKGSGKQLLKWESGDNETNKHLIKSKECDFSKITVIHGKYPDSYGYASIDRVTGHAMVRLDWTTSSYTSFLRNKKDKSGLFYIAITILAEEWVKQLDVTDTVQQFIYKHTKDLGG
jgi:hypothetical protein